MRTIELQKSIVYGPVHSRRFGMSLGINLLPVDRKICSLDCVYCQYACRPGAAVGFPAFCQIIACIDSAFRKLHQESAKIDWIMLSGNGEPTLHPDFLEIVELLILLRNHFFPSVRTGILSNSTTCHKRTVRHALSLLDGRFMKLDAGNLAMFHAINQPSATLEWERTVRNLSHLSHITLQSMFVKGRTDNSTEEAVDDWIKVVGQIKPDEVQIYTVERTPGYSDVFPVDEDRLQAISNKLSLETLIPSRVF